MKKILVVVDMQNDFIDGALGTPEAVSIVDNVCTKIREGEWDRIYATKDTHYDNTYFDSQEGMKLPVKHCIENSDGWQLNSKIFGALDELFLKGGTHIEVFFKKTFGSEDLVDTLLMKMTTDWKIKEKDIELTLVGVCTDICVISNALLLKAHYPEMRIVVDAICCAGTTPDMHKKALEVMRSCQIDILNESKSED